MVDVENAIEFDIKMGYNDIECNVKRKSQGVYTNEVIIQHHDSIVTALDLGLALNCQYDLSNRTILNDFDLVSRLIAFPADDDLSFQKSHMLQCNATVKNLHFIFTHRLLKEKLNHPCLKNRLSIHPMLS